MLAALLQACGGGGDGASPSAPATAAAAASSTADARLTVTISDGQRSASVAVEIASTAAQRQLGLMHRESLPEDTGMLFLFADDTRTGFWMKDTLLALDIAHIAADGAIIEVNTREPLDETVLAPRRPYRFTLEVNAGWFARQGLGPGAKVTLPAGLPQPE